MGGAAPRGGRGPAGAGRRRQAHPRCHRHTDDATYFETVTLITHAGRPIASRCCRADGVELAALGALLEDVDLRGCVLTLDALHATRDTARAIVETHGPTRLLAWNRGHWQVENGNHYRRDATMGEDASRVRAGRARQQRHPQ